MPCSCTSRTPRLVFPRPMHSARESDAARDLTPPPPRLSSARSDDTESGVCVSPPAATRSPTASFPSQTGSRFDILIRAGDAAKLRRRPVPRDAPRPVQQPFSHFLVCDFEATCDAASPHYPHEIIEFPVLCVDAAARRVVAEFHSYVRPTRNARLTPFCTALTGITQERVDAAPTLPRVLQRFEAWLCAEVYPRCEAWRAAHTAGLSGNLRAQQRHTACNEAHREAWSGCEEMVCFATDGPWDMRKFMFECSVLRDGHCFPPLFYRWVNLRQCFAEHFRTRPRKLTDMLRKLGLTFHGHLHSGIDDTRNIARILIELLARGYRVNRMSTIKYGNSKDLAVMSAAAELLDELGDNEERKPPRGGKFDKKQGQRKKNAGASEKKNNRRH